MCIFLQVAQILALRRDSLTLLNQFSALLSAMYCEFNGLAMGLHFAKMRKKARDLIYKFPVWDSTAPPSPEFGGAVFICLERDGNREDKSCGNR
jgi:hypothetical protein